MLALNPGMIASGDIRAVLMGGPDHPVFKVFEKLLSFCTPSTDAYAERMVPSCVTAVRPLPSYS